MTDNVVPFNPLDKKNLGATVAEALLASPARPLGEIQTFHGAGIYAIYYTGDFAAYAALAARNVDSQFLAPIYIGKAIPSGARKGISVTTRSLALVKRLREHADSLKVVANLNLADFYCRYLVVDDIWIPLGESLLIGRYAPVWNSIVDGFGNHDPGAGRYTGMRPKWDVLHPGRGWAEKCRARPESADSVGREIQTYLRTATFTASTRFVNTSD